MYLPPGHHYSSLQFFERNFKVSDPTNAECAQMVDRFNKGNHYRVYVTCRRMHINGNAIIIIMQFIDITLILVLMFWEQEV